MIYHSIAPQLMTWTNMVVFVKELNPALNKRVNQSMHLIKLVLHGENVTGVLANNVAGTASIKISNAVS